MGAKIHVRWSDEDGEYVATHDDYPSLSWLDDSPEAAALGMTVLVREVEDDGTRHDLDDVLAEFD